MIVYLALGSNLGDRRAYLESAVTSLSRRGVWISRSASVYMTEPHDLPGQPWFLNTAVETTTSLTPQKLLDACLDAEEENSRTRTGIRESRTLDIDIIFYGDAVVRVPRLTIPHPGLPNRRFVLEPMAEIAPDFVDPASRKTIRQLLQSTTDLSEVQYFGPPLL